MPPPTTNLIVQLDAGTFVGSDGDPIGSLADQSGNSNNGTASGMLRPTYKTGIVNGLPVMRFSRASGNMLLTPASASLSNYTCFAVIKPSGTANYRPILGSIGGTGGLQWRLIATTNVQNLLKTLVADIGSSAVAMSISSFQVVAASFSAASTYDFYYNGSSDGGGTHAQTLTAGRTLNIGYSDSDNDSFDGDIAEVLVYDAVLSSTNRDLATAYLATKYAISLPIPMIHKPQRSYRNIGPAQRSRRP